MAVPSNIDTLPPQAYNFLMLMSLVAGVMWLLVTVMRFVELVQLHKANAARRVVYVDGMGHRLQALDNLSRAHLDAIAHACQVTAPSSVKRLVLPARLCTKSIMAVDPSNHAFRSRLGVTFALDTSVPCLVQLFWGVDWPQAWAAYKEAQGDGGGGAFMSGSGGPDEPASASSFSPFLSSPNGRFGRKKNKNTNSPRVSSKSPFPVIERLARRSFLPTPVVPTRFPWGSTPSSHPHRGEDDMDESAAGHELVDLRRHLNTSPDTSDAPLYPHASPPTHTPHSSSIALSLASAALSTTTPVRLPKGIGHVFTCRPEETADYRALRLRLQQANSQQTEADSGERKVIPLVIVVRPDPTARMGMGGDRADVEVEALVTMVTFQRRDMEAEQEALETATASEGGSPPGDATNLFPLSTTGLPSPPSSPTSTSPPPRAQVAQQLVQVGGEFFTAQEVFGMDDPAQQECVICLTEAKDTILLPCRHLCVCAQCLHYINKCPVCRTHFDEYLTFEGTNTSENGVDSGSMATASSPEVPHPPSTSDGPPQAPPNSHRRGHAAPSTSTSSPRPRPYQPPSRQEQERMDRGRRTDSGDRLL